MSPRLYLASRSPRRRELLNQIGIAFDTLSFRLPPREDPETSENPLPGETPVDYVQRVARAKARHGWQIVGWRKPHAARVRAAGEFEARLSAAYAEASRG